MSAEWGALRALLIGGVLALVSFLAPPPATPAEVFWTGLTGLGVIYTATNLREAFLDMRAIRAAGIGNGRNMLAVGSVKAETARLLALALWFAAGLVSALTIPADTPRNLVVALLTAGMGLTVLNSVLDRALRQSLIAARTPHPEEET